MGYSDWDGKGPIDWLDRVESGPRPRLHACGAVTTPMYGRPMECGRPPGHRAGHMTADCRYVWPRRDWETG